MNKKFNKINLLLTVIFTLSIGHLICPNRALAKTSQDTEAIPDDSVYQLKVNLEDQNSATSALNVFAGSPVVISLFYASCSYSCPLLFDAIKKTLADLTPEQKKTIKVLLVSFDPSKDTPEALLKLSQKNGLDLSQWKLVRAKETEVADLAAALDIKYRKINGGDFNHTPYMGLLDEKGVLKVSTDNFSDGRKQIVSKMNEFYPVK